MINSCIVGCGAISKVHANAIKKSKLGNLYALCDIDNSRLEKSAEANDVNIKYSNYDDVLKDENVDVVHICTPHYLHFEMIEKAISANKKVICEKPITMTRNEFQLLISKYIDAPIFPVLQNRLNNCIVELKKIINEDKSLGNLKGVKGILTWKRDKEYYDQDEWRGKQSTEGGGVLINQALHTLDIMNEFGGEIGSLSASSSNLSLKGVIEVEDTCTAMINYKNGVRGVFFATNSYETSTPMEIELDFENAQFNYCNNKLFRNRELIATDELDTFGKLCWGSGHNKLINNVYEVIENKAPQMITLKSVVNTMNAMFNIYDRAKDGRMQ